jgi:cytochrome P450
MFQRRCLHNVIREGMRLRPVAAMGGLRIKNLFKISNHSVDCEKARDSTKVIPKGSIIMCNLLMVLHIDNYFTDPEEFQPSRWEIPSKAASSAFLPFMTGPRSCLGQSLANAQMRCVLSRLCADYKFTVVNEGSSTFFLTYKPVDMLLAEKI